MFTVGQKVRVRQWNDMAEEFGLNDYGYIDCPYEFIPMMEPLCGRVFTISYIHRALRSSDMTAIKVTFEESFPIVGMWNISIQMLEPIEVKGWKIGEVVKIGDKIAHVTGFTWNDRVKLSNGDKIDVNAQVERADTKGILVGDYVKIRSWDSMKKEFGSGGSASDSYIDTPGLIFLNYMCKFCGLVDKVSGIRCDELSRAYYFVFSDNPVLMSTSFKFTPHMVKKVKNWEE